MDEKEQSLPGLFKISTRNSEVLNYSESIKQFQNKEWEYEKRIVSSLLIGSGGGLSLLLAYLNSNELSQRGEAFVLLTACLLVLSLIGAGLAQVILNEAASVRVKYFTAMNNKQNCAHALERHKNLKLGIDVVSSLMPHVDFDVETARDNEFEWKDKKIKFKQVALQHEIKAVRLENQAANLLKIVGIIFILAGLISIIFVLKESL